MEWGCSARRQFIQQEHYYCGWVEWYPSYNILCQFDVNPGDDMFVETWDQWVRLFPG